MQMVVDSFHPSDAPAPTAGRPAVIGKAIPIIVLQIIRTRQAAAAAIHRHMALIIVKSSNLQFAARAKLALCHGFFMPAALQLWTSIAPEQRRKSVEFPERCSQFAPRALRSEEHTS